MSAGKSSFVLQNVPKTANSDLLRPDASPGWWLDLPPPLAAALLSQRSSSASCTDGCFCFDRERPSRKANYKIIGTSNRAVPSHLWLVRVQLLCRAVAGIIQALHQLVLPHHQTVHHPEHDGLWEERRGQIGCWDTSGERSATHVHDEGHDEHDQRQLQLRVSNVA